MPIHREGSGYQWGGHGKVYPTRAGAERQAAAAHAHGYAGKDMAPGEMGLLRKLLSKFFSEEEREPEHQAGDATPVNYKGFRIEPIDDGRVRAMEGRFVLGYYDSVEEAKAAIDYVRSKAAHDASHEEIARRIKHEYEKGHPLKQAIAIAFHEGGEDAAWEADQLPAAGVMFHTPDGHALFMRRRDTGEWAFPGGGAEGEEAPEATAAREAEEETGRAPDDLQPLDRRVLNGVDFHTFSQPVDSAFTPKLNHEHDAARWHQMDTPPTPLHPGVRATLSKLAQAEDALGDHVYRVQCMMKDPAGMNHPMLNTVIRTVKVRANGEVQASEKATAFYKTRGYKNIRVTHVEQTAGGSSQGEEGDLSRDTNPDHWTGPSGYEVSIEGGSPELRQAAADALDEWGDELAKAAGVKRITFEHQPLDDMGRHLAADALVTPYKGFSIVKI